MNNAQGGDEILLQPGATYKVSVELPKHDGDEPVTIRSATADERVTDACRRIGPANAPELAKIVGQDGAPAIVTNTGASHWRLVALELTVANAATSGAVVELGQGNEDAESDLPTDIELDRVWIHADPTANSPHGLYAHGKDIRVFNSWIDGIQNGSDVRSAVIGWNAPGPVVIANSYLQSAGSAVRFGTQKPSIAGLAPTNLTVAWCDIVRPRAWDKDHDGWDGTSDWRVGPAVELGNAVNVTIRGNRIENVWDHEAFLLKPFWSEPDRGTVRDVTILENEVWGADQALLIVAGSGDPTKHTSDIEVSHNLMPDVGNRDGYGGAGGTGGGGDGPGGTGRFLQFQGGIDHVELRHNTILQREQIVYSQAPNANFVIHDNMLTHGNYGIFCEGGEADCFETDFPAWSMLGNVISGMPAEHDYPPDNAYPTYLQVGFQDAEAGDYRLGRDSRFKGAANDGSDPGANFVLLDDAAACRTPR